MVAKRRKVPEKKHPPALTSLLDMMANPLENSQVTDPIPGS